MSRQTKMRPFALFAVSHLALLMALPTFAAEVGYRFGGVVFQSSQSPWGVSIPQFSSVRGGFIYDLDSPVTHRSGDCDCVGYRQQRLNGFFAKFGNVSVRADDYVIEVLNDFPQAGGKYADIVSIRFSSDFTPPLELPLVVDSVPHSIGLFDVNLVGPPELFSTSALPTSLNLASFSSKIGFLSDTPTGMIDILYSVTSLASVDLLPGDYDFDNDVDGADYDKWKATFGSTGELIADGNANGIVDVADYTVWRNFLGVAPAGHVHMIVPEPWAATFLVLGILLMVPARSRHSCQRNSSH